MTNDLDRARARTGGAVRVEHDRAGLRAHRAARGGEGRPLRPLLAQPQVAAPPAASTSSCRPRTGRRAAAVAEGPSARSAPRRSTAASWPSTATTRSPSSAAPTSPSRARRTCSPRSSSGGAWPATSSSRRATSPSPTAPAARYRYHRPADVLAPPRARARRTRATLDGAFDGYAGLLPRMVDHVGRRGARRPGDAGGGPRARRPGAGARPAARPAAGRDHRERRHLRLGPGLRGDADPDGRPPAARGARVRRGACCASCAR